VVTFYSSGGTCTLTAAQGGNGSYSAASPVQRGFSVLQWLPAVTYLPLVGR
jgi:hypothetical protein